MAQFGTEFCDHFAIATFRGRRLGRGVGDSTGTAAKCTRRRMCFTTRAPVSKDSRPTNGTTARRTSFACTITSPACKRAPRRCDCRCRMPDSWRDMVERLVAHHSADIPAPPSSLYLQANADRDAREHRCCGCTVFRSHVVRTGLAGRRLLRRRCGGDPETAG